MSLDTTKILKKVKYNGVDFALNSEWQPDADMQWARSVCENDVDDEYTYKILMMIPSISSTTQISIPSGGAIKTSDGFYQKSTYGTSIEHTWDDTNARKASNSDYGATFVRWVITYFTSSSLNNYNFAKKTIYLCVDGMVFSTSTSTVERLKHTVQYIDFINGAYVGYNVNNTEIISQYRSLLALPHIEINDSFTSLSNGFYSNTALLKVQSINLKNVTSIGSMFNYCYALQYAPDMDTSNVTAASNLFGNCSSLRYVKRLDLSKATSTSSVFENCSSLKYVTPLNLISSTNMSNIFTNCYALNEIILSNTHNITNMSSAFSNCTTATTISEIDMRSATSVSSMFYSCKELINLTLKNINISLEIGRSTSFGHLLTLDSLLNTFKELWDNTEGTSTKTLTVGSANKNKLANVYVKLIDITDEMRAEDEFIDLKLPFVVCESTDEGGMLVTDYVTSKNWTLA